MMGSERGGRGMWLCDRLGWSLKRNDNEEICSHKDLLNDYQEKIMFKSLKYNNVAIIII